MRPQLNSGTLGGRMTTTDERELAGLRLNTSKLSDVLLVFGVPTFQSKSPSEAAGPELVHSAWEVGEGRLATIFFATEGEQFECLLGIRIDGTGQDLRTGAGLSLGAVIQDATRLYGQPTSLDPPIFTFADGTTLTLSLSSSGAIAAMQLFGPFTVSN